jgi:hypothetical protein
MRRILIIFLLLPFAILPTFAAQKSTLDRTIEGKSCHEDSNQTIHCDYKVGNDFHLTVSGVGRRDAAITFMRSDFNGDFYGTVGIMHGCVIVKRGKKSLDPKAGWGPGSMVEFAFISPANGKVYGNWEDCKDGL